MIVAFNKNELKDGTKRKLSEYSNDLETRTKNEFDSLGNLTTNDFAKATTDLRSFTGLDSSLNFNNANKAGTYLFQGSTSTNAPFNGWGVLIVFTARGGQIVQLAVVSNGSTASMRVNWGGTNWQSWNTVY